MDTPRLRLIQGGGDRPLPDELIDDLPRHLIVEYPATISLAYDLRTGQVTQTRVEAMPDRANLFDRETWHELPPEDTSVQRFVELFDPRAPLKDANIPVTWLEKDTIPS